MLECLLSLSPLREQHESCTRGVTKRIISYIIIVCWIMKYDIFSGNVVIQWGIIIQEDFASQESTQINNLLWSSIIDLFKTERFFRFFHWVQYTQVGTVKPKWVLPCAELLFTVGTYLYSTINHCEYLPHLYSTINHSGYLPQLYSTINHSGYLPHLYSTTNHCGYLHVQYYQPQWVLTCTVLPTLDILSFELNWLRAR